jgi:hypothetical protein
MTKLLQIALKNLEMLPEARQDEIANAVLDAIGGEHGEYHLSDAQVAEVNRRLGVKRPATVSARKAEHRLRYMRA